MFGASHIKTVFVAGVLLAASLPVAAQTDDVTEYTDPFVRGLQRLDAAETARKKALEAVEKELEQARLEMERIKKEGVALKDEMPGQTMQTEVVVDGDGNQIEMVVVEEREIISDPSFTSAFSVPRYRLDGILVSEAPVVPVIHVNEDELRRGKNAIYWSGSDRRWVYRLARGDSYLTVAKAFKMHPQDLLDMNRVRNPDQLAGKPTLYISPRDNGPLIHTVRKGESLNGLAMLYDVPARLIKQRNKLAKKDFLIIGQRLYIRDKTISEAQARQAIPAPTQLDRNAELMARKPYARLARYPDLTKAMRGTREFYADFRELVDSDLVLRLEIAENGSKMYNLDIGPMSSRPQAEGYCELFKVKKLACETVMRVPGQERLNTFESQAIVRVSPTIFYDEEISSELIEINKTKDIQYHLKEGQTLGVDEGVVVKITKEQILVTDKMSNVLALNLNYLPEVDQEVLQARKEAERQAQLNAAAAAAAAAAASVDAPELETPNIAKRLAEGERERRKGSTDQLP